MKLVGSSTSPFVRKVRVILAEKRIAYEFVEENAWTADITRTAINPLGKVPVLVMDDGESIYDSRVIVRIPGRASPVGRLNPGEPAGAHALRRYEALGDGIADAGIAVFLERKREAARQDPAWIERQQREGERGHRGAREVDLARSPPRRSAADAGRHRLRLRALLAGFRLPEFGWRADASLRAWAESLGDAPSFAATRPAGLADHASAEATRRGRAPPTGRASPPIAARRIRARSARPPVASTCTPRRPGGSASWRRSSSRHRGRRARDPARVGRVEASASSRGWS